MKKIVKFCACIMALLMIFTSIPAVSFSAFAEELQSVIYDAN